MASAARYAMHIALSQGWFKGYDWVIRINPDVMVLDEERLVTLMGDSQIDGVFASCGRKGSCVHSGCKHGLIQTDVFAVRPGAVAPDAFRCWNTSTPRSDPDCGAHLGGAESHAEEQATKAFRPIVQRAADAWITNKTGHSCRINGGGLLHVNGQVSMRKACGKGCTAWSSPGAAHAQIDSGAGQEESRSRPGSHKNRAQHQHHKPRPD